MTDAEPTTPRWVKIFLIVGAALLALFAGIHLAGGGFRHHHGSIAAPSIDDAGAPPR